MIETKPEKSGIQGISRLALVFAIGITGALGAEDTASDILGIIRIPCLEGSDTLVGIPFERYTEAKGSLLTAPRIAGNSATFQAASPDGDFAIFGTENFYLRWVGESGSAGAWHRILSNAEDSFTIDQNGNDLSSLVAGDPFEIVPYWTLNTLFDPATQSTIHVSAGPLPTSRSTEVLITDLVGEGISLAPDRLFFLTADGWHEASSGFPAAGDEPIQPGQVIVIRHPAGTGDTYFVAEQRVLTGAHRQPLRTSVRGYQDNVISLMRPATVKLSDLDLSDQIFVDSASTAANDRVDELLLFDNASPAFNKAPFKSYFRIGGTWHEDDGASYPVADDDEIPMAAAVVIRKAPTSDGRTLIWIDSPEY
ncbi:MAG: TIGR02597 family protein [Verrucomicrobiae bacterium]|nr:TIGR02597 family protein [Verrucomicrobiae bacterium]